MAGQGKTDGALIGNPYVTSIAGEVIVDIGAFGNAASTTGTISGVLVVGVQSLVIGPNARIHDVTRHGAMSRPNPSQAGMADISFFVSPGSKVWNCGGIGLQGTRVKNFIAITPRVKSCVDNCIDVYGNDSVGGSSNGFVGYIGIDDSKIDGGACGIFIESATNRHIKNPAISNCPGGIKLNRINSGALYGQILGGFVTGKEDGISNYGVPFSNNCGCAFIEGVTFDHLLDSMTCGAGTDRVRIGRNNHRRIGRYIVGHTETAKWIVKSTIEDQYIFEEALSVLGWPQLTPPITNPKFATAQYQTFRGTLRSISNNADFGVDFEQFKSVLTSPSSWGGAFSLYNVGGDGETRINTNPDVSLLPGYVTISGVAYYLVSSGIGGKYYVRQWNGTTAVAGDYRGALNSALVVSVKYSAFTTA